MGWFRRNHPYYIENLRLQPEIFSGKFPEEIFRSEKRFLYSAWNLGQDAHTREANFQKYENHFFTPHFDDCVWMSGRIFLTLKNTENEKNLQIFFNFSSNSEDVALKIFCHARCFVFDFYRFRSEPESKIYLGSHLYRFRSSLAGFQ